MQTPDTREQSPEPVWINDPRVLAIPIQDNNEALVSILDIDPARIKLPQAMATKYEDLSDTQTPFVRESVRTHLVTALGLLPENLGFVIIEPYRDYGHQKGLFEDRVALLMSGEASLDRTTAEKLATEFVSNPDIYSPHVTGGAIDIALFDLATGDYVDIGTNFEFDDKAATICPGLSEEQVKMRNLLVETMQNAGFVNYPKEVWHYSIGDKYYAFSTGHPFANYGAISRNS